MYKKGGPLHMRSFVGQRQLVPLPQWRLVVVLSCDSTWTTPATCGKWTFACAGNGSWEGRDWTCLLHASRDGSTHHTITPTNTWIQELIAGKTLLLNTSIRGR